MKALMDDNPSNFELDSHMAVAGMTAALRKELNSTNKDAWVANVLKEQTIDSYTHVRSMVGLV
eukprot:1261312-Pyramimonas_sp.AAC.1